MLKKESSVFTVNNGDIYYARTQKMEVNLIDDTQIQQSYYAIPGPLYGEVKSNEDLMNQKMDHSPD